MKRLFARSIIPGLIGVILVVHTGPSAAQTGPELPQVLAAEDVFTDAVEVVERLPITYADTNRTTRVIRHFDPATSAWIAFDYPAELAFTNEIQMRADGTLLVGDPGLSVSSDSAWSLTLNTGEWEKTALACGEIKVSPGEGEWRLDLSAIDGLYYLCSTESGTQVPLVLEDIQAGVQQVDPDPALDRGWVVFASDIWVYAYQPATGALNRLGSMATYGKRVEVVRWADATHPVLHIDFSPEWSVRHLAIADVTQPDSMRYVGGQVRWWPSFYDDPPRYEWVLADYNEHAWTTATSEEDFQELCQVHVFDLTQQKTILLPYIPTICTSGIPIPNGNGDRLARDVGYGWQNRSGPEPVSADLVRFNPYTNAAEVLYTGEIEWLIDVSADGRHAFLILGDDGELTYTGVYQDAFDVFAPLTPSPVMAVFDLDSREIVETYPVAFDEFWGFPTPQIGADALRAQIHEDVLAQYDVTQTLLEDGSWEVDVRLRDHPLFPNGFMLAAWIVRVP